MPKPLQLVAPDDVVAPDTSSLSETQLSALVQLLARADRQEVMAVFSALGPEGARRLGRELRRASEQLPAQGDLYRRALIALICADLAQPFN